MRIVFMGSPEFALPTLQALAASRHEVVAVVTQPDRPAGRGRKLAPPPVKLAAQRLGLRVLQPANVSAVDSVAALAGLSPDVLIVAAYGQILRQAVLALPRRGSLNVHASLLPRHRGASPVAAAILAGDEVTGVSIMEVVRALDAGPVVAKAEEPVLPTDTTASLEPRLARLGADLLMRVLDDWAEGRLRATPQDDTQATYAPMLKRGDALIDWSKPALRLWREVRAYNPWPVSYTYFGGPELKVWEAWPLPAAGAAEPGTVFGLEKLPAEAGSSVGLAVAAGEGRLALVRVQAQGRKIVAAADFARGQRGLVGSRLGQ
jgi:methionyl-tRNA formyltransferase